MSFMRWSIVMLISIVAASSALFAQDFKMPPEVTPALRAACEQDVRRLCIDENPSVAKVKSCVARRYLELSSRCKMQIAAAGLTPGR